MLMTHHEARERIALALVIAATTLLSCVSLALLAPYDAFHIFYSGAKLPAAALSVAVFGLVSLLFVLARFSFGYLVGFHLYLTILGYLWLGTFSDLAYDHRAAGLSAALSGVAFLVPALLVRVPIPQAFALCKTAFEKLLLALLALAAAVVLAGAAYNFRVVSLLDIYNFRLDLQFPTPLNYLIGITSSALLPFAFACFVLGRAYWLAGAVLLLLLLYYPITLSKNAFFAPFWLVYVTLFSGLLGSRLTVVVSLALPLLVGTALMAFFPEHAYPYSHIVNLRLFAIPSNAMDFYNHFFAQHDHTHFCQVSFLKSVMACPYHEPLSVIMQEIYQTGFLNASMFATEGIASVGVALAPVVIFACGLVFALANSLSAGLPSRFVLISGAILPIVLNNVPLSTVLLTHGAGALFLLWYVMPRDFLPPEPAGTMP
jgi:hypothetical protein